MRGLYGPRLSVTARPITHVTQIQITVKEHFRESTKHLPPAIQADPLHSLLVCKWHVRAIPT